MYESPHVELDIHAYLPGNILNFKVDSLSLLFNRISVDILDDSMLPWVAKENLLDLECVSPV